MDIQTGTPHGTKTKLERESIGYFYSLSFTVGDDTILEVHSYRDHLSIKDVIETRFKEVPKPYPKIGMPFPAGATNGTGAHHEVRVDLLTMSVRSGRTRGSPPVRRTLSTPSAQNSRARESSSS